MKDSDWLILSELYKTPNMTKVAELLYTTQPSMTKRLQHMEEEFGVAIVRRTSKGLVFTQEGEYLCHQAEIYLRFLEETRRELDRMKHTVGSVIRIGSSYTYSKFGLSELILQYQSQHPEVHFQVITEGSDSLFRRMLDGTIDVAFLRGDYDGSLNKVLVERSNAYVVTNAPVALSNLKTMTRIGYSTNRQTQKQLDDWYTEQFGEPAPANISVGYIDVAWQLVERGAGYVCCFVPERYEGRKRLFLTPMCHRDGTPVCRSTWFSYPKSKRLPKIQTDFIHFVKLRLAEQTEPAQRMEE